MPFPPSIEFEHRIFSISHHVRPSLEEIDTAGLVAFSNYGGRLTL